MERMESGVVVSCEENNKEGACDMPCEDAMLIRGTQRFIHASACLEPREKNHVCGSVEMHVLRVVGRGVHIFSTQSCNTTGMSDVSRNTHKTKRAELGQAAPRKCLGV